MVIAKKVNYNKFSFKMFFYSLKLKLLINQIITTKQIFSNIKAYTGFFYINNRNYGNMFFLVVKNIKKEAILFNN